ncbi:hypothetical protein T03_10804 [Trichinella britovi]|uniref:Uncharacterized protein n=2 Tax=Trichinella TaxID=6333 RepID=A0A0V1DIZ3_TRIBR|nr:hypothetical protein T05_15805 [Trichinella murrelli]KRY61565.1 hypothetical protein T03_10804 [Trichinella britovi]
MTATLVVKKCLMIKSNYYPVQQGEFQRMISENGIQREHGQQTAVGDVEQTRFSDQRRPEDVEQALHGRDVVQEECEQNY